MLDETNQPHAEIEQGITRADSFRQAGASRPVWKSVAFRAAAVLLSLSPLLICEFVLVLIGWQPAGQVDQTAFSFHANNHLFQQDATGKTYQIDPQLDHYFRPQSFPVEKAEDEFRVFVLGGSTVQGRPFETQTAFPYWLELTLEFHHRERPARVINCGGVSYASNRLEPILYEVLNYEPDLVILCTGHNEFLEERTFAEVLATPAWWRAIDDFFSALRTVQLAKQLFAVNQPSALANNHEPLDSADQDIARELTTRLDFESGMDNFHRDPVLRAHVELSFQQAMERMVIAAQKRNVMVWLVAPPANLSDCPPFKSEVDPALSAAQRAEIERLLEVVQNAGPNETLLRQILLIDPYHAQANYQLAQILDEAGKLEEAKRRYQLALDHDVCPLRMTDKLRQAMRFVAQERGVKYIDLQSLFAAVSPQQLTGSDWFLDHVHPTINGHQQISRWLFSELVVDHLAQESAQSDAALEQLFVEHLQSLDYAYFQRGQDRLRSVLLWSRGQTIRPETAIEQAIRSNDKRQETDASPVSPSGE
jgi:lysophospholipase L1-like esterase